uniref:hypothetical protein n=1 Tax=Gonatophragmium mori TaxID=2966219 RepID=UPI0023D86898|nr:hypothetical protein P2Z26_mgp33 [Gonatophragmium mori]WCZ71147.1 hypothetical protein [Gonatophragmium mori]
MVKRGPSNVDYINEEQRPSKLRKICSTDIIGSSKSENIIPEPLREDSPTESTNQPVTRTPDGDVVMGNAGPSSRELDSQRMPPPPRPVMYFDQEEINKPVNPAYRIQRHPYYITVEDKERIGVSDLRVLKVLTNYAKFQNKLWTTREELEVIENPDEVDRLMTVAVELENKTEMLKRRYNIQKKWS